MVNRNSNIVRRPVYALVYVTGLAAVLSPVIAFVTSR